MLQKSRFFLLKPVLYYTRVFDLLDRLDGFIQTAPHPRRHFNALQRRNTRLSFLFRRQRRRGNLFLLFFEAIKIIIIIVFIATHQSRIAPTIRRLFTSDASSRENTSFIVSSLLFVANSFLLSRRRLRS